MKRIRIETASVRRGPRMPFLALLLCIGLSAVAGCGGATKPSAQPTDANGVAPSAEANAADAGAAVDAATPTAAVTSLTKEDEAGMVALIKSLFGAVVRDPEPDMQNVIVRQMTTPALRSLRGLAAPDSSALGYSSGYVWVIGFKTKIPLTLSTYSAENQPELTGVGESDSLAGPDGLTSLYYVVATTSVEGNRRFEPLQQGILLEGKTKWTLSDLAALPATP
ncbi:MAG: hypothetical protein ABI780_04155 [Ardenticatenales bacterium]